ncbi:WecB/TagA/CpsF family glycosyltransferase [Hyphomicrobium sp.]|uniref:WecB/TagA/CpsF family glycosyltransferase n=1 Tax=Hyphomicrobium sp. TaxID=82 RepID=UPI0025C24ADE|nr:WecB/TagA/CpsF family glycosyltransferase [Hyphomicrobium sp.]MCC7250774.1 WecB/TagA/CpsF family glycosyltransferase [Hyphomicrobium sp.]
MSHEPVREIATTTVTAVAEAPAVLDAAAEESIARVRVAGAPVSVVDMDKVLDTFGQWVGSGRDRVVLLRDVHGAMCARKNDLVREAQEAAELVLPDGVPLTWAARLAGQSGISRVCGIDLLPRVCRHGVTRQWRHFFYGASPNVADQLAVIMREQFPGIAIVGTHCPPFRPLTADEDAEICAKIREAKPDFVWVSLSTPKQDLWMQEHRGRLGGVTMIGVGGAFEINAGLISRAPMWMQRSGLEWLYRLAQEPGRLWKRYFECLPRFAVLATLELIKQRLAPVISSRNP